MQWQRLDHSNIVRALRLRLCPCLSASGQRQRRRWPRPNLAPPPPKQGMRAAGPLPRTRTRPPALPKQEERCTGKGKEINLFVLDERRAVGSKVQQTFAFVWLILAEFSSSGLHLAELDRSGWGDVGYPGAIPRMSSSRLAEDIPNQ